MTARTPQPDDLDLMLTAWLDADSHVREPDDLLARALARTSGSRPLPAWRLPERWLPMQLALRAQPGPRVVPILVVLALIVATLVAIGLVAGSRRHVPPPFGVAVNGRLAFVRDGRLVTENPDGAAAVMVGQAARQQSPSYSLDGTRLVYKENLGRNVESRVGPMAVVDVVVANADGGNPVVVAHDVAAGNPLWSPDGQWIAYAAADDHGYVVAADGSGGTMDLGDFGGAGAWTPSFSPDSQRLAVAAGDGTLWVVDRDGSNARRISHGTYPEVGEKGWSADWSPDGTKLLFGGNDPEVKYNLYMVGLDGAPEQLVSEDSQNGIWSPDGSLIAYLHTGIGYGPTVRIADRTGKPVRALDGYYGWYMPAWSPDQTRIAILDDRPGPDNGAGPPVIALLDPQGIAPTVTLPAGRAALTDDTSPDYTLTWQRLAP